MKCEYFQDKRFNIINVSSESLINTTISESNTSIDEEFRLIKGGSKRGKDILIHKNNCYNFKHKSANRVTWRCSKSSRQLQCNAIIAQMDNKFILKNEHKCSKNSVNNLEAVQTRMALKEKVKTDVALGPSELIESYILANTKSVQVFRSLRSLKQNVKRYRNGSQKRNPKNLKFDISEFDIPKRFLLKDIQKQEDRILIFSTEHQRKLLNNCKVWFLDGTFKIVSDPFLQLLSIHGCIRNDDEIK